jgi:lipoprotein-anchoring transpeptidase ErfK/SrfK
VLPTFEQEPGVVSAMAKPLSAVGREDGDETVRLQERLLELGFWVQSTDGIFGLTTRQAVMAAQKYFGLPATSSVDEATAEALSTATTRPLARSDRGTLVEIDKSLQLGFFVIDGVTEWVLNVSTGSEIPYSEPNQNDPEKIEEGDSITDPGLFKVDRERAEGWWDGDLGSIYRPKYFNGGIAVHGSGSIPNYPASHGCVRVSTRAMDWIWEEELMPMGTPVWVHGSIPR